MNLQIMKNTLIVILMMCYGVVSFAQSKYDMPDYFNPKDSSWQKDDAFLQRTTDKKKIDFQLEAGTTFGTMNGESLFSSYVSPYLSYPLSPKFSVEVGSTIARGNMLFGYSPFYGESFTPVGSNLLQTSMFVRGRYHLSENLSVFGTGYVQRNIFLTSTEEEQSSFNTKAMSFGLDYKLGEHSHIHFEIQTRQMQYPGLLPSPGLTNTESLYPYRQ